MDGVFSSPSQFPPALSTERLKVVARSKLPAGLHRVYTPETEDHFVGRLPVSKAAVLVCAFWDQKRQHTCRYIRSMVLIGKNIKLDFKNSWFQCGTAPHRFFEMESLDEERENTMERSTRKYTAAVCSSRMVFIGIQLFQSEKRVFIDIMVISYLR